MWSYNSTQIRNTVLKTNSLHLYCHIFSFFNYIIFQLHHFALPHSWHSFLNVNLCIKSLFVHILIIENLIVILPPDGSSILNMVTWIKYYKQAYLFILVSLQNESFTRRITSFKLKARRFTKSVKKNFLYTKYTIWSYSAAKNISKNRACWFFFNGEEGEENHKEATGLRVGAQHRNLMKGGPESSLKACTQPAWPRCTCDTPPFITKQYMVPWRVK